jgi:hypothetical protein
MEVSICCPTADIQLKIIRHTYQEKKARHEADAKT